MSINNRMNHLNTKAVFFAVFLVTFSLMPGCSKLNEFFEEAPLEDGLYLSYYFEKNESYVTIKFSKIHNNEFYATMETEYDNDEMSDGPYVNPKKVKVDKRLNKENGAPYNPDILGPMWTSPSSIKSGGTIHGAYINEIKPWNDWDVAVVKASFGRGAITGEWYYDKKTGFLVGGNVATVIDENGSPYVLDDTNLKTLMP